MQRLVLPLVILVLIAWNSRLWGASHGL